MLIIVKNGIPLICLILNEYEQRYWHKMILEFFKQCRFFMVQSCPDFCCASLWTWGIQISWNFYTTLHGSYVTSFYIFIFLTVRANRLMTYLKMSGFYSSKIFKTRSKNDRHILFFGNNSKYTSQPMYFLTVHRLKLISLKNNWK